MLKMWNLILFWATIKEVQEKQEGEAFAQLEQLRKKDAVIDYDAELASYRDAKYGKQNFS